MEAGKMRCRKTSKTKSLVSVALVLVFMMMLISPLNLITATAADAEPPFETVTTVAGDIATVSVRTSQVMEYSSLEMSFNGFLPNGITCTSIVNGADINDFNASEEPNIGESKGLFAVLNEDDNVTVAAGKELCVYTFDLTDAAPGTYNIGFMFTAASDIEGVSYDWEEGVISAEIVKTAPATYTVLVAEPENGTASADKTTAEEGETIHITATPNEGYELDTITYTAEGGEAVDITEAKEFEMPAANVTVNVTFKAAYVPVTGITLNKESLSLKVGGSETLTATVLPENASDKIVTWTSSAPLVATVDSEGKVTAVSEGTATITAAAGDYSAACAVTVTPDMNYDTPPFETVTTVNGNTATVSIKTTKPMEYSSLELQFSGTLPEGITLTSIADGADIEEFDTSENPNVGEDKGLYAILNEDDNVIVAAGKELCVYTFDLTDAEAGTYTISYIFTAASDIEGVSYDWEEGVISAEIEKTAPVTYTVLISEPENGTASADKTTAEEGETVHITATPNESYELDTITYTAEGCEAVDITEAKEFVMPAANVTVNVTFKAAYVPVTGITLNKESLSLKVEGNEALTATVLPENASDKTVAWTSSAPSVATVDNEGKVTAVSEGTATITAAAGDFSATCAVTVTPDMNYDTPPFEAVATVNGNTATVSVKTTKPMEYSSLELQFNGTLPEGITLTSIADGADLEEFDATEDPNVGEDKGLFAILNEDENVTVAAGKEFCVYTFDLTNAEAGTYSIGFMFSAASDIEGVSYEWEEGVISAEIVKTAPATYTVIVAESENGTASADKTTAEEGETVHITATPNEGYELDTITYTAEGGEAVDITEAKEFEMPAANVTVNVTFKAAYVPVTGITLNKESLNLKVGGSETLTATVLPENASDKTVTRTSSAPSVATVDSEGKVTAVSEGTVTITAAAGDYSAACAVTVTPDMNYDTPPFETIATVNGNTASVSIKTTKPMEYSSLELQFNGTLPEGITLTSIADGADLEEFDATEDPNVGEDKGLFAILNEDDNVTVAAGKELCVYTFDLTDAEAGTYNIGFIFTAASDIEGVSYDWEEGVISAEIVYEGQTAGYIVTLDNRTAGKATVEGIVSGNQYSGDTVFTVTCDDACVVAYTTDGGQTYTKLTASGTGNTRSFTVPVNSDTVVFIALKGDATLDGRVNSTDATQVKRYAVQLRTFGPENLLAADVTGEGRINATDATQIKRFAVKLRTFDW